MTLLNDRNFSFIHVTDHHLLGSDGALLRGYSTAWGFRRVMQHIADHVAGRADFIVSTGDLVQDGTDVEYAYVSHMLHLERVSGAPGPQRVSIEGLHQFPMYFLPGNHDSRYNFYRHLFPQSQPAELMNVTFEHKGLRFICLDWGPKTQAVAYGETLDFLAEALRDAGPAIILMHHQVVPLGYSFLDGFIADDVDKFWELVEGQDVLGIFCGHVHRNYEINVRGIPVFGLGATSFQFAFEGADLLMCMGPLPYRLVTIQEGVLSTEIFEVSV